MGDSKSGYVYSPILLFGYLASIIVDLTIQNLIYTAVGVFGALVLLMDLRMAVFIVLIVAIIDVGMSCIYACTLCNCFVTE